MSWTLSSGTLQRTFLTLLGVFALILAGCRREKIPPYREAAELKFRVAQAKDLADPRGDLAFIQGVPIHDTICTFGAGLQNKVVLAHWGPEPLQLKKQGDSVAVLNSPKGTTLDGKAVLAGMSVSPSKAKSEHWINSNDIAVRILFDEKGPWVQIFDGKSPALQELHSLKWYPPAPKYRVAAEWIPLSAGHSMLMHRTNGGPDMKTKAAGYLEFRMEGQPMRLYALIFGQQIFIVFRDFTSKSETYPSGRFLEIPFSSSAFDPNRKFDPGKKTKMALDFNQAINPACAYNPNTKCPIAPPENRLPIAIPAGEKRYH